MTDKWISISDAERWTHCTAAGKVSTGDIINTPGTEEDTPAAEGTAAHKYADAVIRRAQGRPYDEQAITAATPETITAVNTYLQYLKTLKGRVYSETPLTFGRCRGFADAVVVDAEGRLTVVDYKHGAHTRSYARGNAQLILYALAAAERLHKEDPRETITLAICQPRMSKAPDIWKVSLGELQATYLHHILPAETAIINGDPPHYETDAARCRGCRHYPDCPGWGRAAAEVLIMLTDGDTDGFILDYGPGIVKAITAYLDNAAAKAERDGCPEGYELTGRTIRTIPDDCKDAATRALLSAGAAPETILKPRELKALTNLTPLLDDAQNAALAPYIRQVQQARKLRRIRDDAQTLF